MKNTFLFIFCLSLLHVNAQQTTLSTNFGGLFSGAGDQHGKYGAIKAKTTLLKGFYATAHWGIGHTSRLAFGGDQLRTIDNLLILDKYTENYPLPYIQGLVEPGNKNIEPYTDFTNYTFTGLGIGRQFNIGKHISLNTEVGGARVKMETTYVTYISDADYRDLFTGNEFIPVKAVIPLITSFIDYTYYIFIDAKYKINDRVLLGIFGTTYGSTINSAYGLSVETVLFGAE